MRCAPPLSPRLLRCRVLTNSATVSPHAPSTCTSVQDGAAAAAKVVAMMRKVMPHADTPRELDGKSGVWYTFLSLLDSRSSIAAAAPAPLAPGRGTVSEAVSPCNI